MSFQGDAFQQDAFQVEVTWSYQYFFGNPQFWAVVPETWWAYTEPEMWWSAAPARVWWAAVDTNGWSGTMAQQILQKRTAESRVYDINCTNLLLPGATIASVTGISADQGSLVFGAANVNNAPVTYPDGSIAATGCAIQVNISGGSATATNGVALASVMCTIRAVFVDTLGQTLEAAVLLNLSDQVVS